MGEERMEEEKKEERKAEEKTEEKKEEEPQEIVLKVDMHCEACARKVARALKGFEGVEAVSVDSKGNKVVVKGKTADPIKVCERLQKKSGRKVEIISPLPKPPENTEEKKEVKEEPPVVITVVLKVQMHCEACAQVLQKRIRKIQGVESVETDLGKNQVIVKGVVDPAVLVKYVYKRTRKQASIVKDEKEEGEKKEEPEREGEKKEGEKEKAEEEEEEKKLNSEIKRLEYLPYASYPPQIFSDENPNACFVM